MSFFFLSKAENICMRVLFEWVFVPMELICMYFSSLGVVKPQDFCILAQVHQILIKTFLSVAVSI